MLHLSYSSEKPIGSNKKSVPSSQVNGMTHCIGQSGASARSQSTWVHEIFQGTLTNETRCLNCETVTLSPNFFIFFTLELIACFDNRCRRRTKIFSTCRWTSNRTRHSPIACSASATQKRCAASASTTAKCVAASRKRNGGDVIINCLYVTLLQVVTNLM